MSSQDKLEQILREIHVLVSQSPLLSPEENFIVVDKKAMYEHLNRLNVAIYEIMDEYELTKQSRDRAERDAKRHGDDIVQKADRQAEDVYAASILYTNDALSRMQYIMQDAIDKFERAASQAKELLAEEKRTVRANQSELAGQLQDLKDTEKYMMLLEDANRRIDQEREAQQLGRKVKSPYADIKPEIRVNPEYFERLGIAYEEEEQQQSDPYEGLSALERYARPEAVEYFDEGEEVYEYEEPVPLPKPEVKVNLDSEYFKRMRNMQKP